MIKDQPNRIQGREVLILFIIYHSQASGTPLTWDQIRDVLRQMIIDYELPFAPMTLSMQQNIMKHLRDVGLIKNNKEVTDKGEELVYNLIESGYFGSAELARTGIVQAGVRRMFDIEL